MQELSDFELIRMYIAGNTRAFEILYGRYRTFLYAFLCRLMSSDQSEIDDIFQQIWLRTIDRMPHLKEQGSFYGYLQQTARNLVIDRARKLKRRGIHMAIDADDTIPIADMNTTEPYFEIIEMEDSSLLDQAVKLLSDEQRRVWELRMQNLSFKEIAEIEQCSLNTALARMSYAKKNIKIFLGKHL